MKQLTENILSYFAGIVDGEGSIGIAKCKGESNGYIRQYRYRPFFSITNTHLPMLQYLKKHFGGSIAYSDERTQCYNMTFSANKIREILPELIPYLLIKKKQAEIVLEFLNRMKKTVFSSISDELYDFYEKCCEECKALKIIRWDYKPIRLPYGMKKCAQCGKDFMAYSYAHKYCSRKCKSYAHLIRTGIREVGA